MENMQESPGKYNFQSMFSEIGVSCDNFSIPGGSNSNTLTRLSTINCDEYDKVIVFQTDPLRELFQRQKIKPLPVDFQYKDCENINQLSESLLSVFYTKLVPYHHQLILIGGLSKLYFASIDNNINTFDKSWTEIVINDFVDCYYEWYGQADFVIDQYAKSFGWSNVDTMKYQTKKEIYSKNHAWQSSDQFSWCHPGDGAYEKMFEVLCSKLDLL